MTLCAKDIMVQDFETIDPNAPVEEAIYKISNGVVRDTGYKTISLMVVDEMQRLCGVVAMFDLLYHLRPDFLNMDIDSRTLKMGRAAGFVDRQSAGQTRPANHVPHRGGCDGQRPHHGAAGPDGKKQILPNAHFGLLPDHRRRLSSGHLPPSVYQPPGIEEIVQSRRPRVKRHRQNGCRESLMTLRMPRMKRRGKDHIFKSVRVISGSPK